MNRLRASGRRPSPRPGRCSALSAVVRAASLANGFACCVKGLWGVPWRDGGARQGPVSG